MRYFLLFGTYRCQFREHFAISRYRYHTIKIGEGKRGKKRRKRKKNEQNNLAVRWQAESWGDKVGVCWWYGLYDVSIWWATEVRQNRSGCTHWKKRTEKMSQSQRQTATRWSVFVEGEFACSFGVIPCDIACDIALDGDIRSHTMWDHKLRHVEVSHPYPDLSGLIWKARSEYGVRST